MTEKNIDYVDLKFTQNKEGVWDLSFTENGDIEFTNGIDTALAVTFFTDQRASSSEVSTPQYRQGWWGTILNDFPNNIELGSKIWLLQQSPNNQATLIRAVDYLQKAYEWLIDLNYVDNVEVTAEQSVYDIALTVKLIKNSDVINQQVFNLWENTISEINNGNL